MDPYQVYEHLKAQVAADRVLGYRSTAVPLDSLQTLLDGIDLDDAADQAEVLTEEGATFKVLLNRRQAQITRLQENWEEARLQLTAIKELATVWRNETANRMVSSDDHDIKRAAELLLKIIR